MTRQQATVDELVRLALEPGDPAVLGQLGAPELPFRDQAIAPLAALCEPHEHPDVVHAALCALGHLDDPRALDTFLGYKHHSDPEVRLDADSGQVRGALTRRLNDRAGDVAGEAMVGLARRGDPRAFDAILAALTAEEPEAGNLVVEAAAELADPRLHPALLALRGRGWARDDPRPWWLEQVIKRCAPDQGRSSAAPGRPAAVTARARPAAATARADRRR